MDPLENAKSADHKTECIVFGYIHGMKLKLKLTEIASLITHMILGFYYNPEFITKFLDKHFKVSQDKLTITNIKPTDFRSHSIYLNQWINSTESSITKWTFKINNLRKVGGTELYFALVSFQNDPSHDLTGPFSIYRPNYCVNDWGRKYENAANAASSGFKLNTGSVITFTLDLISREWSAKVHDKTDKIKLFDVEVGTNIKYKFGLQIVTMGNTVTLVDFSSTIF